MASVAVAPVPNENRSTASRITKEGRRITYVLNVIQKPERARACGQGAKSSSDRRPVDPPPIVDLHVYEGEERDGRDITFTYNANFFLFATLESARPIAHGRVPPAQQNSPVLTGTPVAGMAYLDRPHPAGYFIFPDLSVRHEGKYRLAFTLFEEVKDPKDADNYPQGAANAGAQVLARCEVKSSPFTVFSAKKFPGLTESTQLSRTVADQGCRVRIRRDIRMRKRSDKDSKEWDNYEDATAEQRAYRSSTPESHAQQQMIAQTQHSMDASDRARSVSNASNASTHPLVASRRPSAQDLQQQYQAGCMAPPVEVPGQQSQTQQPPTPHPPQHQIGSFVPPATISGPPPAANSIASQAHMSQSPQAAPGYVQQAPYEQAHMAQYPPAYHAQHYVGSQPMAQYQQQPDYAFNGAQTASLPPTPQVQHQQQPTAGQQQLQAMGPPSYGYMQQPAVYENTVPQVRPQESIEYLAQRTSHTNYNRGSVSSQYSTSSHPISPMTQEDNAFGRTPMSAMNMYNNGPGTMAHGKDLPPLQVLESAPPHKTEMSSPMTSGGFEAGARPAPPPSFARGTAGKRSYGSTFNTQHIQEPLRAGARPNTVAGTVSMDASDGSDEDIDLEAFKLSYRRADGNRVQKVWSQSAL